MSEKAIQAAIVQLLRSIGAAVYVLGTVRRKGDHPGTMQTKGIGDLYVFLRGPGPYPVHSTLWIEVKAKGGRLRPEQVVFQEHCALAQQDHLVGGIDDVIEWLKAGGWVR